MLSDNTNKIMWIAITVGLVATIGVGALTLFPASMDTAKTITVDKINNLSNPDGWKSTEPVKQDSDSETATTVDSWSWILLRNPDMNTSSSYPEPWGYKYVLPQVRDIKPGETVKIKFEMKSDEDRQLKLDANTNIVNQSSHPEVAGNDQDDISQRKIYINGELVAEGNKTLAGINKTNGFTMKKDTVYTIELQYTNNQSVNLIDQGTSLRFSPYENDWQDFHIGIRNIKYIVGKD